MMVKLFYFPTNLYQASQCGFLCGGPLHDSTLVYHKKGILCPYAKDIHHLYQMKMLILISLLFSSRASIRHSINIKRLLNKSIK